MMPDGKGGNGGCTDAGRDCTTVARDKLNSTGLWPPFGIGSGAYNACGSTANVATGPIDSLSEAGTMTAPADSGGGDSVGRLASFISSPEIERVNGNHRGFAA